MIDGLRLGVPPCVGVIPHLWEQTMRINHKEKENLYRPDWPAWYRTKTLLRRSLRTADTGWFSISLILFAGPGCPYRIGDLPADFHTTEIINK